MTPIAGPWSADHAFALTKWYFDCLCDDGRAAIGYCAGLTWRGLSLTWQAITVWNNERSTLERSSLAVTPMPSRVRDRITWNSPGLGCVVVADLCQPAAAIRLLQTSTGSVDWRCEAPLARVAIDLTGAAPVRGTGYVECLDLTIPPWRLPIRELRWGRWADRDAGHSIVWVDWRGETPRTWVLVDGVHVPAVEVKDDRVDLATSALTMIPVHTLSSRSLDAVVSRIPPLRAVVPNSFLSLREVKWLSRGTWQRPDKADTKGSALHERVVFR